MARMTRDTALQLLGLSDWEVTPERVQEAFTFEVKRMHPDTVHADPVTGAPVDFDRLKQARDLLRQVVAGEDLRCKPCGGRGTVRHRMGVKPCGACKGTGDRQ